MSALLYFGLRDAYHAVYPALFTTLQETLLLFPAVKFVLAMGMLVPPAFFVGGTLPVVAQHLVRRAETLGRTGAFLYASNTFGGALGAYVAGFHLPPLLGFRGSYLLAVAVTGMTAALAWLLSGGAPGFARPTRREARVAPEGWLPLPSVYGITLYPIGYMSTGRDEGPGETRVVVTSRPGQRYLGRGDLGGVGRRWRRPIPCALSSSSWA